MLSGKLLKLGGGTIVRLQERDFVLNSDGTLDYFESGKSKGTIEIKGSTIIDRGSYMGHLCFSIEGRNSVKESVKEYFLFTDDRSIKWKWISALQNMSGRYNFFDDEEACRVRLQESSLNVILAREGNGVCADCSAPFPSWAVVFGSASNTENFGGIFVCIECIGVHRSLWPDRCKEVVLDDWSGKMIEKMAQGGNLKVNSVLEFNTDGAIRPTRYSLPSVRERYIKEKYSQVNGVIKGSFSTSAHSTRGGPVTNDLASKETADLASASQPPRYIGVVLLNVIEASNFPFSNVIVAVNNGYQEVRSMPSTNKSSRDGPLWNQLVQVGIDTVHRPLYATFFDGDKIVGTSEINLSSHFKDRDLCDNNKQNTMTVSITGNSVSPTASFTLSVHLTRLA